MPPAQKRTPAKAVPPAEPKPEAVAPQEDQAAQDAAPSDVDVTSAQSQEPAQEPAPEEAAPAATSEEPEDEEALTKEPEMVNVTVPCPTCYPEGWYEDATDGTVASCPHLAVPYGQPVILTAQEAFDLGYRPLEG